MSRINYPLTIDQLIEEAIKAKKKFGGDKFVLVSDDEEGNGYHECYFSFSDAKELIGYSCVGFPYDLEPEQCVTLG